MRRVVVTGMGAVSPLGNDLATTWDGLVAGKSGLNFIQSFDTADFPVKVGAEVKDFDPTGLASPKELRKLARYTQFSLAAAKEAVEDADLVGAYPNERIGVVFGSAVGDIGCIAQQEQTLLERGPSRVAPWFIPSVLTDAASGQLAISFGFSGINFAMVAACATGSYTLGEGAEIVRRGAADAILAGGAEAALTPLILAGFSNMRAWPASRRIQPTLHVRSTPRATVFVIGEGAGILVLEELEAARARGAKIHAEVVSYGASNDAYHVAQPDPEAGGVARMMTEALAAGGIEPEQVGYINAHGHLDSTRRRRRDEGDQGRLRRPCLQACGLLDQSRCSGTASAPPARSRRSPACWRSSTGSSRRRSTTSIPTPNATSTTSRTSRARPTFPTRSRTGWVSAATTAAFCSGRVD